MASQYHSLEDPASAANASCSAAPPGGEEERKKQQSRIHRLLLGLGATEEELAAEQKAAEAGEPAAPPLPASAEDVAANGDVPPEPNGEVTANGIHEAAALDTAGATRHISVANVSGESSITLESQVLINILS